jgi:hypothetical protein
MSNAMANYTHSNWRNENQFDFHSQSQSASKTPLAKQPAYQGFRVLQVFFAALLLIDGIDKFFGRITDWNQYLSPLFAAVAKGHEQGLVMTAGAAEVILGVGVLLAPRLFGYLLSGWLLLSALNLVFVPGYYDIALKDVGLAAAAFALARLAMVYRNLPMRTRVASTTGH